jgi:hypothetical protein
VGSARPTDRASQRALPDHTEQIAGLTARFNQARYSHHAIEPVAAVETRTASRLLRSALRSTSAQPRSQDETGLGEGIRNPDAPRWRIRQQLVADVAVMEIASTGSRRSELAVNGASRGR